MTRKQELRQTQLELLALGACPTAEPPDELADTWRGIALRIATGDKLAHGDARKLRELEMGAYAIGDAEAEAAMEAYYATETA